MNHEGLHLRARTPNPVQWSAFVNDPVGFVYQVIGASPDKWQKEFMMSVATGEKMRTAVKACHGPGKTAVAAWLILWWMCTRPFPRIPCTAPTEHQLHDKLWPELHKWHRKSKAQLWRWFEWEKTKYYLREEPQEWFAVARVARVSKTGVMGAEAFGMQGFHADHLLFIIDEASGVDDAVYAAVQGALTGLGGEAKAVAFGNPNIPSGWFYESFHKHSEMWDTHTVSYMDSPKVSDKWAEEMIDTYGMGHPWVQVKVLGEFPDLLENGLFTFSMISNAQDRVVDGNDKISIGIDVARYGDAKTVFAISDGPKVRTLKSYRGMGIDEVALEAEYVAKQINADFIVVDADGVGAGTVDILRNLMKGSRTRIVEWNGGNNPFRGERYRNSRAEGFWLMKEALTNGEIELPASDSLARQASAIRYTFDDIGRILLEKKKKIIDLIGESPDELDATCYSLIPYLYRDMSIPARGGMRAEDIVF